MKTLVFFVAAVALGQTKVDYPTQVKNGPGFSGGHFTDNPLYIHQYISPYRPLGGFPLGGDMAVEALGPADIYLVHNDHAAAATTTTTSISPGTQNITVGSTANFSAIAGYVYAGREQTNQEACTLNSIASATVMNITCVNSHTGTTDIEQIGQTILKGQQAIALTPVCPANAPAGDSCPVQVGSAYNAVMVWPVNAADTFPKNAFRTGFPITGMAGAPTVPGGMVAPDNLKLRNASPSYGIILQSSDGNTKVYFTDTGAEYSEDILSSPGGARNLGNATHAFGTVYVGNGGGSANTAVSSAATAARTLILPDANAQPVISAFVTTTASGSDVFTVQGITSSSKCSIGAANASAAANIASTFIGTTGANSITMSHSVAASMVYALTCTAY